jgi:hypothetical protein
LFACRLVTYLEYFDPEDGGISSSKTSDYTASHPGSLVPFIVTAVRISNPTLNKLSLELMPLVVATFYTVFVRKYNRKQNFIS